MPSAYLTIDDSPSERTDDLTEFLDERDIPALFFVRGAFLEGNPGPIVRAIEKGFVIGNHGYAHIPAGEMGFEEWAADFEKAEALIETAYERSGRQRPGLYYRFPYIDRGDGQRIERAAAQGGAAPADHQSPAVERIQSYLRDRGFTQPFDNAELGPFKNAADCLFTYTTGDWMLTQRHKGQWPYKTPEDLKAKIDGDESLKDEGKNHIILAHDQAEIHDVTCALIDHFLTRSFAFLRV